VSCPKTQNDGPGQGPANPNRSIRSPSRLLLITLRNVGNWPERNLVFFFFRAISVILGDKWKAMKQEDRREYVIHAKLLADEHKRVNPDCWKRKRNCKVSKQILFTYLHNFLIGLFGRISRCSNPFTSKSLCAFSLELSVYFVSNLSIHKGIFHFCSFKALFFSRY